MIFLVIVIVIVN